MNVWDDPHYKGEKELIEKYPLLMSYPRTGAHWINAVMELYFDRPRLKPVRATFLPPWRDDWLWYHDHDIGPEVQLGITHDDVLYLYRNPTETIYSWIIYNFNDGRDLFESRTDGLDLALKVEEVSEQYHQHLLKWLVSDDKARTHVRYENFKKDPVPEFKKIREHFKDVTPQVEPFESLEHRAKIAFEIVTPEALTERRTEDATLSDFMRTQQYKDSRDKFRDLYDRQITYHVITDELEPFFENE